MLAPISNTISPVLIIFFTVSVSNSSYMPLTGGGQGHTQITHPMGLTFWVTELRATEVSAMMENFDLAVDLVGAISYRMENGAVGSMGATGSLRPDQPGDQRVIYYGSRGFLRQDLTNGRMDIYYNDGTSEILDDMTDEEIYPAHLPSRSFVDLILGHAANMAPGRFGAYTVEFLDAAYRSAASGKPAATS